jgi:glycosyltransferase involved in cell wall biosynthesis
MDFLFVHNNFPAQFGSLAGELARSSRHRVAAIGAASARSLPNVRLFRYQMPKCEVSATHPFARRFDVECRRAEQVLFAVGEAIAEGFEPDCVIAHSGWGETLPLRAVFPKARHIVYCEFFYRPYGQDVHFDPEAPRLGVDGVTALHGKNASTLIALADADLGLSPTEWQRSTYPREYRDKIEVVHEGVDTRRFCPNPEAAFTLPDGRRLTHRDEVVTFVSRNLEPLRGYHKFLRALPEVLARRPEAVAVIVGGDGCSYSHAPPAGTTWKAHFLEEVADRLDLSRVHLLDRLPYGDYLRLLQVSSTHVYLTYPFVLSWSLVEAMSVGCAIVASDTAPVREAIVDGESGLLAPFHDSSALAEAIVRNLNDQQGRLRRGRAARAVALNRYDRNNCLRRALRAIGAEADESAPPQGRLRLVAP